MRSDAKDVQPRSGDNRSTSRTSFLDAARGIGICLVVLGHVERGLVGAGIATGPGWIAFDAALYSFHMPLFMFLAGINVPGSLRRGTGAFLRDKVGRIAYPYVLWSLIQGTILVLLSDLTNGGATWGEVLAIGWRPMAQFWFLYALLLFQLLVAATGGRVAWLGGIALVALLAGTPLRDPTILHRMCFFLPFFVLGIVAADAVRTFRPAVPALWLAGAGLSWLASLTLVDLHAMGGDLALGTVPAALFGTGFVLIAATMLAGRGLRIAVALGLASMSIYVMHILAAAATRIAIVHAGIAAPASLHLLIGTLVGIGAPFAAHGVLRRCNLLPVFGLGRAARLPGDQRRGASAPS